MGNKKLPLSSDIAYPSTRYLQIHFEHIQDELLQNRRLILELQKQVSELMAYIDTQQKTDNGKVVRMRRSRRDSADTDVSEIISR
jgi:hypothetical protein